MMRPTVMSEERPRGPKIVLGVTGCIGAYKAPEVVRTLRKRGFRVQVILTRAAREFVTPLALETVSGAPVLSGLFGPAGDGGPGDIRHISLTEETDLLLVAPATAHTVARMALGLADDFLTTFHLAVRAPVVVAPAMNPNMLEHPATRAHLETLAARGVTVVDPGVGDLACGWTGPGRLPEPEILASAVEAALAPPPDRDLAGYRVVVAAGPTREPLDPVRYLSNRSSGRMGVALARAARERGAEVTLVLGPTALESPGNVREQRVETALEMRAAVLAAADAADACVMAAAVSDFRPRRAAAAKMKSGGFRDRGDGAALRLDLEPNPDILAELGRRRRPGGHPRVLVGFAAETEDPAPEAKRKLAAKGCDLIVGNRVGPGLVFGSDRTEAVLVEARGDGPPLVTPRPPESKRDLADAVWSAVARRLRGS